MDSVYLDHAATTPTDPEVMAAMMRYFGGRFGNPSSIHACGRDAREALETARSQVAELIGAAPEEIVFTGGGTEADNLAVLGAAAARPPARNHLVTTAIEHPAVLNACKSLVEAGCKLTVLAVDPLGRIDPEAVREAIRDETFLVSIMHGNNEIGAIEPIAEAARVARERGVPFHTDAVQTAGKIPVAVEALGVDLLSLASHKIYGPKGVGALYVRRGTRLAPRQFGGHQEGGLRSGTENVPGIVGMGRACEIARRDLAEQGVLLASLRDRLEGAIRRALPELRFNGHPELRLPNILSVSVDGVTGEVLVREMDKQGFAVSAGSACTSESPTLSHVLTALNLSVGEALGTVRFSLGRTNTAEQIDRAADAFIRIASRLQALAELEDAAGRRGCR